MNETDEKLLNLLSEKALTVDELCHLTGFSRFYIYFRLGRLAKAGGVKAVSFTGRRIFRYTFPRLHMKKLWYVNREALIQRLALEVESRLRLPSTLKVLGLDSKEVEAVREMVEMFNRELK